ncbi:MAG: hypothetical protein LBV79_02620 [Candidatus Adiutrix sp.]|jgi:hypothetical protein|nr:hypothetical protein [Candidatus Adiutrix sp.]
MPVAHPLFGELEYNEECEEYQGTIVMMFAGAKTPVELKIAEFAEQSGIETLHCATYEALTTNWNAIEPAVLQAIVEYQNEEWSSTDYTQSFPQFETADDAARNVALCGVKLELKRGEQTAGAEWQKLDDRYAVLYFNAEWVNNDYRVLSVELTNEEVTQVSDQDI